MPSFSAGHVSHTPAEFHHNGLSKTTMGGIQLSPAQVNHLSTHPQDGRLSSRPNGGKVDHLASSSRLSGNQSSGSQPTTWPAHYALDAIPDEYATSAKPGVYVNRNGGSNFIVANDRAYAVSYDKDNGTYRILDSSNPSRFSYPVRRNPETGQWEIHNDVGLKGGGDNERWQLESTLSTLRSNCEASRREAQQLQVDLQHVENGLLGYRSNNLTPPAEMLMLRQQRDQELNRKLLHVGFLESEISSLQYKLQSMRATKHY